MMVHENAVGPLVILGAWGLEELRHGFAWQQANPKP